MTAGVIATIVSLAIAAVGLATTLGIAYLKEKTDTAKRNGSLGENVKNLGTELQKLQGMPQQITELKGQIKAVDDRLNGLPEKMAAVDKRIQKFEDICPAYRQLVVGDCKAGGCEDKTNPKSEKGD